MWQARLKAAEEREAALKVELELAERKLAQQGGGMVSVGAVCMGSV